MNFNFLDGKNVLNLCCFFFKFHMKFSSVFVYDNSFSSNHKLKYEKKNRLAIFLNYFNFSVIHSQYNTFNEAKKRLRSSYDWKCNVKMWKGFVRIYFMYWNVQLCQLKTSRKKKRTHTSQK